MNRRPTPRSPLVVCSSALLVLSVFSLSPRTAAAQAPRQLTCDTDVEAPVAVRAAYAEYYYCLAPILGTWSASHPAEAARLEELYSRWREARGHDLRDRPEASRWIRQHPVEFSHRQVELTESEVRRLEPGTQGAKVAVPGAFQRLFVDRDNERLFLTSATEGLVTVDISRRYAFALEGSVGAAGARDFFVLDETTAFAEETVPGAANRDLVVLDISDRAHPLEVARLRGAIPAVSRRAARAVQRIADSPPAFEDYVRLHEGLLSTHECGAPPVVPSHRGIHCRSDGTCYRRESVSSPNEGYCARASGPRPLPRVTDLPRSLQREEDLESNLFGRARAIPTGQAQGGEGGAGSLTQMMAHGGVLYVLSGTGGRPEGWLTTFDLAQPRHPRVTHVARLDNGPEALHRHDNLLLIAGRDALITASLGEVDAPRLLGELRQECPVRRDPVVVQGSLAYRTIIGHGGCVSRLEVIELAQPHQPLLRATRNMSRPRGLFVLGERLFVADERSGIHVFDLTDAVSPVPAGVLRLNGVQDVVLSGFDLHALTPSRIETYFVGPLFERAVPASAGLERVKGFTTVECVGDCRNPSRPFPRSLSRGDIMRVVAGRRHDLRDCVERQRAANPSASGTIVMGWIISPDGTVQNPRAKSRGLEDTVMAACLTEVIGSMRFPSYEGPRMPEVEFPFNF
jgi:hypothetical protein